MKDKKFKKVSDSYYSKLRLHAIRWVNKCCNNGIATLKGIRQCYGWKDAYIVLCHGTYMSVPKTVFEKIPERGMK